jgi:hypothetical protein
VTVEDWSVKIAEEVCPVETEFAPLWAEAFLNGGKDRQNLFVHSNAQASGFLPGDVVPMLPQVLSALASVAPVILKILASENVGLILEVVKRALSLGEIFSRSRVSSPPTTEKETLSEAVYASLNSAILRLETELKPLSLTEAQTDRISLVVLRLLLENRLEATQFLKAITEKK